MIIHKELKRFLETIYTKDLNFRYITECELHRHFKNNEYYNLKNFCLENELIIIDRHHINLTFLGIEFFNFLKKLRKI